jgi:hypothetical protein
MYYLTNGGCGCDNSAIYRLKTIKGVKNRLLKSVLNNGLYKVYKYTDNIYGYAPIITIIKKGK